MIYSVNNSTLRLAFDFVFREQDRLDEYRPPLTDAQYDLIATPHIPPPIMKKIFPVLPY